MTSIRVRLGAAAVTAAMATALLAVQASSSVRPPDASSVRAAVTTKRPAKKTATKSKTTTTKAAAKKGVTSLSVASTVDQYFILYFRPDAASPRELPVSITRGKAGTTTLTDGRTMLSEDRYRVVTGLIASPGDVDGDGIDDLTELDNPKGANPLNAAPAMDIDTGAVLVPDRATFEVLSYQGDEVARDAYLAGLEFVKFWIVDTDTDNPSVYVMNTESYRAHPVFAGVVGIAGGRGPSPGKMRGDVVYDAKATAPDGTKGRYRFAFQPNDAYSFSEIALAYESLITSMPVLTGKLVYYPFPQSALPLYESEKAQYNKSRVPVLIE
jgi:hypothetical protein